MTTSEAIIGHIHHENEDYNKYILDTQEFHIGNIKKLIEYREKYKSKMIVNFIMENNIKLTDYYRIKIVCKYRDNPAFEEPLKVILVKKSETHKQDSDKFIEDNKKLISLINKELNKNA